MDPKRRVVNYALLGLVGTGGYVTSSFVFGSLEPPLKARLNAATLIDTTALKPNEVSFFKWRKKPLFLFKYEINSSWRIFIYTHDWCLHPSWMYSKI
jgi:ubiquinol-cytochrome c reductase iron-sulfur subunit